MKIAAAQLQPHDGNTEANIQLHCRFIKKAIAANAELIVFPEMSLTGYALERAAGLSFSENDPRLQPVQQLLHGTSMTVIAGAPIRLNSGALCIGAFIITEKEISIYTKQYLHTGEEVYFSPGFAHDPLLTIGDARASIAICADITNPLHPEAAHKRGTSLYIAGIFYTPGGIEEAYRQLSDYAKNYSMNVLMANFCGASYNFKAAGRSACWNNKGELCGNLDGEQQGLLIADIDENKAVCETVYW